jgi:hypothetical protein
MPTRYRVVSMAFAGMRDGAALFGGLVALLGGASLSLIVAFWGLGMVTHAIATHVTGRCRRRVAMEEWT